MHNQYLYNGEVVIEFREFFCNADRLNKIVNYVSFLPLQDIRMVEKEHMLKKKNTRAYALDQRKHFC